jgi:hypothetical protein
MAALVIIGITSVAMTGKQTITGTAEPASNVIRVTAPVASSTVAPTTTPVTETTVPPPSQTNGDPLGPGAAKAAVDAVDALAGNGVQLGVAVLDRASGQETDGTEAGTTFPCASVLKLFLITDLLHQQEQGALALSPTDLGYIHSALTISDDHAMDMLWGEHHGAAAIDQLIGIAHLQDSQMTTVAKGGKWGGVLISARDVLAVYQYVLTQLSTTDRDLVISNLNNAAPTGYQGFNQAFGLLNPATRTSTTKAKQGWSAWYGNVLLLHTTGILDGNNQIVVAILSSRHGSGSDAQFESARQNLDSAAGALISALGPNATR